MNQDDNDFPRDHNLLMKASEAAKILKNNPEAVVLDIRTPKEYAEGHIPDAINVIIKQTVFGSELEKLDSEIQPIWYIATSGRRCQLTQDF